MLTHWDGLQDQQDENYYIQYTLLKKMIITIKFKSRVSWAG